MTTIRPTALVENSCISISDNNRPGEHETYISVDRGMLEGTNIHGGKGFTALDQNEAYEVIKAIAVTSGLLYDEFNRILKVRQPAPKKTPQQIAEEKRRVELMDMNHSDLRDLVLSLEKEGGRL